MIFLKFKIFIVIQYRPCDVFGYCTNTIGGYFCSCREGYTGDGKECRDIDECKDPELASLCVENAECCNLPAHSVCKCNDKSAKYSINIPSELVDYVAPIIKAFMELDDIENDDDGGKFRLAWRTAHSEDITHPIIDPNKLRETPLFRAIYGLLFHEPIPL